ncbi:hypothetical protein CA85_21780 [Allorhodopirellula solitaria]|uniref:Uncharacterized protein n=1 Tax=Allorhodopirellula solitaria TaxID=2527987 RepID=A0A5C5XXA4_9BACT|nr:hypothetical protein CA85_21780 [Allorhodopirellula solitaria]
MVDKVLCPDDCSTSVLGRHVICRGAYPVVFAYAQTTGYFLSSLSGYLLVTKGARAVGLFHRQILSELRIGASSDGRSRLAAIVLA